MVLMCACSLVAWADERLPVAVAYFDNTSKVADLEPLKKGLAEMLITDLSVSTEIRLVERERLNEVMSELDLQASPYIDASSAVTLGQGLGAVYIVTGSYIVQGEQVRIDARMVDVATAEIALTAKAEGARNDFLSIERGLATQLLEGLSGALTLVQKKKIGRKSTGNLDALSAYSTGLDALDAGDTKAAAAAIDAALKADPDFQAAQTMRERVEELAEALKLATYEADIQNLVSYIQNLNCECSPVNPSQFPNIYALSKVGLYDEALLSAQRYIQQNQGLTACWVRQIASYVELSRLRFDEAMAWQREALKSVSREKTYETNPSYYAPCLTGSILAPMAGVVINKPIEQLVQDALDDPTIFAKWKIEHQIRLKLAPQARAELKRRLGPSSCAQLCSWDPRNDPPVVYVPSY